MRANPFDGKGAYTKFAWEYYSRLMSREWFSLANVMADHLGLTCLEEISVQITSCNNYGDLKKASRDVLSLLKSKVGNNCIEETGNNRHRKIRYIGIPDNPLIDLLNATAIKDIRMYARFCADSAGFFPMVWLEYFFEETLDLINIKSKRAQGEQIISSADSHLKNIEFLPFLYESIREKRILSFSYHPIGKDPRQITMHPHILKEFNGRWFLFGYVQEVDAGKAMGYNVALDRIEGNIEVSNNIGINYIPAPHNYYQDFFKNKSKH